MKAQFPLLRRGEVVYLDTAATAQVPEAVLDRLLAFETMDRANVHDGGHRLAQRAFDAYEGARRDVARFLGVRNPGEIVFSGGATAALNLACATLGRRLEPGDEILLSALEHHSNLVPWQRLAQTHGLALRFLPVTAEGRLHLDALDALVGPRTRIVSLTHCSNVTGAVTDLGPVVSAARSVGAVVVVDGAQRAPHGPLELPSLGIDLYAFSGHKAYGPTGIGVLWGRGELLAELEPFMTGGQMIDSVSLDAATFLPPPRRFEAGTPPITQAVGLGAAMDWMMRQDWKAIGHAEKELTGRIIDGLECLPRVKLVGPLDLDQRHGVVSFTIDGVPAETVCHELDRRGIAVRSGHLCAQPAMKALGVAGVTRASIGCYTDAGDVDALLDAVGELVATAAGG